MSFVIAQFSDSHLFAEPHMKHCGANVYDHLATVLDTIAELKQVDALVFTGDLTQDHTKRSYDNFASLVKARSFQKPIYYLPGNHDEPALLEKYLQGSPFSKHTCFETSHWQIMLIDSKSATPAGRVSSAQMAKLKQQANPTKFQWLFMHHHPIDVGYFIDRHHLLEAETFWQEAALLPNLRGIACGHVHRGEVMQQANTGKPCDVLTCPATSIQFDPTRDTVSALSLGPGFRLIELDDSGHYQTKTVYL